jgi:hypothetical protein
MSLLTYHGTFTLPDNGSDFPVTGLGFQPKVVLFYATRQTAAGFAADRAVAVGWAVSASSRGHLAQYSQDNVAVSTAIGMSIRDDLALREITAASGLVSIDNDFDLTTLDADGFTINPVNFIVGHNYIIHYFAIGGDDLTNVWIGNVNIPTTAISQAYSGPGFKPDCLLLLSNLTGTIPRSDVGHKLCLGAATSVADQAAAYVHEQNAIPTSLSSLQKTGEILHTLNFAGTDNTVAALESFDTSGFTLAFSTVPGSSRGFLALALKGGSYKLFTETQKTSTGTKAKTGIGFTPTGLLLWGTNRAASGSVDTSLASFSLGASDGAREGAVWVGSVDNVSTTDENSATVTDKVLRHATCPSTTNAEADLSSFDADGFTLNWSTADGTAREFLGLAFGSAPVGQQLAPSADSVDGSWTDQAAGTALAAAIDEGSASDADYIQSPVDPTNSGCRVKLASGTDPLSSTGHVIHWRIRKDTALGATLNMTIKLYQGGGNVQGAGTLIASFDRNNVDGSGWTTYDETLSGAQADSITNYADLYLEFYADLA